jgi:opacity protein-like surface antigen
MRRLLAAVALLGFASPAFAGDFEMPAVTTSPAYAPSPFVPGPPVFLRWSGFYLGGQAGYGSAHIDFSHATESLVAFELRELALENEQHPSQWQVLGNVDTGGASGGGFVGYNSQWDDIVLGVELMYSKTNFSATAPSFPIGRVTSAGGNTYDVNLRGSASAQIEDYATARLRGGYVMRTFMPWAMIGFAVGRMNYQRSATVDAIENFAIPLPCGSPAAPNCVPFTTTQSDAKNNAFIYGWAVGAGVDFMVLPHVLLRAEYEFTSFASVAGIKPSMNTVRVGAGFKF